MPFTWYGTATADTTVSLGPLAVFWPVLERMNLRPILEQHVPTDPQAEFSHAAVSQLLIAARLSNPVALVNVAAWAEQSGAEVLSAIPAAKLNDDRLGRALDAFFAQRHSVLASVALHVARSYGLSLEQLHYDPTHLLLHGAYETSTPQPSPRGVGPAADGPAHITFGHPATETKLVQAGVCSLVDRFGPLPLFGHLTDGNHNGHTAIREQFSLLPHYLRPRELLLVSDRGTFSEAHVATLHRQGFYALCAAPWSDFRALWREHHHQLHWQPASYYSREQHRRRATDSALPREHYELAVLRHTLTDPQTQEGIPARLLFVFSSADQKVARKTRQKAIERIRTGLEQITRSVAEGRRGSDPAALSKRIGKLMGQRAAAAYFRWERVPLTAAEQTALPPPGQGSRRPSHRFVWHFEAAAAERDAAEDAYAVLVTTAPRSHSGDSLFSRYKNHNQVELVHRNWKKPLAVHPLFLQYLISEGGSKIGYGSVAVAGPWKAMPTVYEYFLLPQYRGRIFDSFIALLTSSGTSAIETQSNAVLLTTMLYTFAPTVTSESILFHDKVTTAHVLPDAIFRRVTPEDAGQIAQQQLDSEATWLVAVGGVVAAAGDILFHYNRPYGDIYMKVGEPFRRRGVGTYLVQELKRICYEGGSVPAARCNPKNIASRQTLQRAGFVPCGHIVKGAASL